MTAACALVQAKPISRNIHKGSNVRKALRIAGREDLIGRDPECLVPPAKTDTRNAAKRISVDKRQAREHTSEHHDSRINSRPAANAKHIIFFIIKTPLQFFLFIDIQ